MLALYLAPSGSEVEGDQFCKDTLCDQFVSQLLDVNFVNWAGWIMSSPEIVQLCRSLGVTSGPFFAVLTIPSVGPHKNQLVLLMRCAGQVSASDLLTRLVEVIEKREQLTEMHAKQEAERDANMALTRQLLEEQDREYKTALELDQQQERRRQQEALDLQKRLQEEKDAEERKQKQIVQEIERKKQLRQKQKDSLAEEPASGSECVAMRIRLPDGTKLERRFLLSNKMDQVFAYIESHELFNSSGQEIVPDLSHYRVVTYPKRTFSDPAAELRTLGLGKNCLLIVEEI
jgi:FAS-associated factor 2